jgi:hypothetical protein
MVVSGVAAHRAGELRPSSSLLDILRCAPLTRNEGKPKNDKNSTIQYHMIIYKSKYVRQFEGISKAPSQSTTHHTFILEFYLSQNLYV